MGREDEDSERVSAVELVVGKGKEAEKEEEEVNNYMYSLCIQYRTTR